MVADIATALSVVINSISDIIKNTKKPNIDELELQDQLSKVSYDLIQMRIQATNLLSENKKLKEELEKEAENPLTYNGHFYRGTDGFPYCPACYDKHKDRIHLKIPHGDWAFLEKYRCPICGEEYPQVD
ncbi:MAG: hypothetical protein FWC36_00335 [Spirochaetes bacterium]|nr:hypothetical protein [Spirochaetota bacterium]